MSIVVLELSSTRERFETVFNSFLEEKNMGFLPIDRLKLDSVYTSMVSSLSSLILKSIRNTTVTTTEPYLDKDSSSFSIDSIVDSFNYYLYSDFGIDVSFEKLHLVVSGIETALMNDVIKVLPNIDDDNVKLIGFTILPPNNLSIEYLFNPITEYQQLATETNINASEPVDLLTNCK